LSTPRILLVACFLLCSCGGQPQEDQTTTQVSFSIGALSIFCHPDECLSVLETPFFKVHLRWGEVGEEERLEADVPSPTQQFLLAADPIEVAGLPGDTLVEGIMTIQPGEEGAPVLFSRGSGTTSPDGLALNMHLDGFFHPGAVVQLDTLPGNPNVLFPTATALPDGRILLAGGFTQIEEEDDRWAVTGATDRAYIFDPATGEMRQAGNLMTVKRGAHGGALFSDIHAILLVGGTQTLYRDKDESCFPWYFEQATAQSAGTTYEIFDINSETFRLPSDYGLSEGFHLTLGIPRVFPQVTAGESGSPLISGGGQWQSCRTQPETDEDYARIEVFGAKSDGMFSPVFNEANILTSAAIRSAHSAFCLKPEGGNPVHIFWGGSTSGPVAEVYVETGEESLDRWGVVQTLQFAHETDYERHPFFHAAAVLNDNEFLVVGGLNFEQAKLSPPSAEDAWRVRVDENLVAHVEPVGGLGQGCYFHSIISPLPGRAVVSGGFAHDGDADNAPYGNLTNASLRLLGTVKADLYTPQGEEPLESAIGAAAAALRSGCLFIGGGLSAFEGHLSPLNDGPELQTRGYCPSNLIESWEW
jgi:hypothetical protein